MGKINLVRVILGGLIAGLVGNVLGYLLDGVMLASRWADSMRALGRPAFTGNQNLAFIIIGFAYGLSTVWLYAAIRPRYGAGPKTAVCAGLAVWAIGVLFPNAALMGAGGLFPIGLTVMTTVAGIVEWTLAALAGAAMYKEGVESQQSVSAQK